MPDYKKMYHRLFSATTNAITILQEAQLETEEIFTNEAEETEGGEVTDKISVDRNADNHGIC